MAEWRQVCCWLLTVDSQQSIIDRRSHGSTIKRSPREKKKRTFYFLCVDQRLFTPVLLGISTLELLFEFRIGFTPENRQVVKETLNKSFV